MKQAGSRVHRWQVGISNLLDLLAKAIPIFEQENHLQSVTQWRFSDFTARQSLNLLTVAAVGSQMVMAVQARWRGD
jgi:hypothetical protein